VLTSPAPRASAPITQPAQSEKYAPGTQDAVAEYIKEDVWPDPVKYWRVGLVSDATGDASWVTCRG
jgi:hypothetical protein